MTRHIGPPGRWPTRRACRSRRVSRIWRAFGLKPHLVDEFKLSPDPQFIDKVRDIVGLCVNPPEAAVVLCVDEKTLSRPGNASPTHVPVAPHLRDTTRRTHQSAQPTAEPPKVCDQTAITIAPDIGARHRQTLAFGTEQWARRYAMLRNTIEGHKGFLKDPAHEALAQPGRRRVRGIAAQSIFCAMLLMATNLRKIRRFRTLVAEGRTEHIAQRAKRRRVRLGDHLPATR
jgi:hypothetical protein